MIGSRRSSTHSKRTEKLALPWDIKNGFAEQKFLWKLQIANMSRHVGIFISIKYDLGQGMYVDVMVSM